MGNAGTTPVLPITAQFDVSLTPRFGKSYTFPRQIETAKESIEKSVPAFPSRLKILHIHDQAGVSGTLAKYQRQLGHQAEVIVRDGYDGYGIQSYYGDKVVTPKVPKFTQLGFIGKPLRYSFRTITVLMFYLYIFFYSRHFDIVHIHSQWIASFFTFKPKVVEWHGDDIRKYPSRKWKIDRLVTNWFIKYFKNRIQFIVSTPDLLTELPEAYYLPNPVDYQHFFYSPIRLSNKAIYFNNWHESGCKRAMEMAKKNGWELAIVDRSAKEHLCYAELPFYLGHFEYLIDRQGIHSLSKTALEALAMGLKVVNWEDKIVTDYPMHHSPFHASKMSIEIYMEVMSK